jgi:opacity protein-like surface antigen
MLFLINFLIEGASSMRSILFASLLAVGLASPAAFAAETQTRITYSTEAQEKFEDDYGVREQARLEAYLHRALERALEREGVSLGETGGSILSITLEDAKPNRPTFKQLGDTPGLSYGASFGIGGAQLTAEFRRAGGSMETFSYRWYESDITQAFGESNWGDAERAMDRFARRLAQRLAES